MALWEFQENVYYYILWPLFVIFLLALLFQKILRRPKLNNLDDRYVLITGCDTGFGYRTALKLDKLEVPVFAACLTSDKVKELASQCSQRLVPFQMDVTDTGSVQKAFDFVVKTLPKKTGLWALINNAGIVGPVGLCEWLDKEQFKKPIEVNLLGTIRVTNTFLPLIRQNNGRVVNTSSVVGRLAVTTGPYSISKFCLEGYTDSLRRRERLVDDLDIGSVSVHTIEPGGYATRITDMELTNTAMEETFDNLDSDVKRFYGNCLKQKLSIMLRVACFMIGSQRLNQVVDAYVDSVTSVRPKTRYLVGWNAHVIFRPVWNLPTALVDLLLGMCYPLPCGMKSKSHVCTN